MTTFYKFQMPQNLIIGWNRQNSSYILRCQCFDWWVDSDFPRRWTSGHLVQFAIRWPTVALPGNLKLAAKHLHRNFESLRILSSSGRISKLNWIRPKDHHEEATMAKHHFKKRLTLGTLIRATIGSSTNSTSLSYIASWFNLVKKSINKPVRPNKEPET